MDNLLIYWQWIVFAIILAFGFIANLIVEDKNRSGIKYEKMPSMRPIRIATKDKGFWGGVWLWLWGVRTWEIAEDFHFELNGEKYVIPRGFVFDGASVPKFLSAWLSPVGVLLMGGLVHDYAYKYKHLLHEDRTACKDLTQKEADKLFRDICIDVNGFVVLNYLAYYALRLGGFVAWNGHRKRDCKDV